MAVNDLKNIIRQELKSVNKNPTDAQKNAGNYKKGHIRVNGYDITIENPKGSYRKWKDNNGKSGKQKMYCDYGYFKRTLGKDGDAIDVFVGSDYKSKRIFVIDQKIGGKFDESKVMFCFKDKMSAIEGYLRNYSEEWKGFWKITEVSEKIFKEWLYDGFKQRKPFHQYVKIKNNSVITENIIKEWKKKYLFEEIDLNGIEKLYHATPSCFVDSIKQNGLGGNIEKRLWTYQGTQYEDKTQGVFLATDEYVALSYVESSVVFDELMDEYGEDLTIVVFEVDVRDLDTALLTIDENQITDDETDNTFFYDGVIPFEKLDIILEE